MRWTVIVIESLAAVAFVGSFLLLAVAPSGSTTPWGVPVLIAVALSLACWGVVPLGTGPNRRALGIVAATATVVVTLIGGFFAWVLARA